MSGPQYGVPRREQRGARTSRRFPVALPPQETYELSIVAVLCVVLVIAAVTLWIAEEYTPEGDR